jgi:sialate O-acetylesterase
MNTMLPALLALIVPAFSVAIGQSPESLKLPRLFSDGLVFQQGRPVTIWGWAPAGAGVKVSFGASSIDTAAGPYGRWRCRLPAMPASSEPRVLTVTAAGTTLAAGHILVGEVWICSGQSNMWWPMESSGDPAAEIAAVRAPAIRMFTVTQKTAEAPEPDCQGAWQEASPEVAAKWSAVAWYFGRALHGELKVPIGLIHTSWGGTPAEAWTSLATLEADPDYSTILERGGDAKIAPQNRAARLFNAMIAPLIPYTLRGAIWYQGESNVPRAWQYRKLFPAMIADWRKHWSLGDFPFYFVQIAPFRYDRSHPRALNCAELREAQHIAQQVVPNTGMAVTMDIGNPSDIHPKNKKEVGERLARWALAKTYGRSVAYCGPVYRGSEICGDRITLYFEHAEGGLRTRDGKPPSHFQIEVAPNVWVNAVAEIQGATVVVSAEGVPEPRAVRYAFSDDAEPNLMNPAGLPAAPFRTDHEPARTRDAR